MGGNSLFSRVKGMASRVVDSFIPIADDEEYVEEEREQQVQQTAAKTQRAAVM